MTIHPTRRLSVSWPLGLLLIAALLFCPARDLIAPLCAALIHELGHMAALLLLGAKVEGMHFSLSGGEIRYREARQMSYGADILIAAAGPLFNLLAVFACKWLAGKYPEWNLDYFIGLNLILMAFNLLPAMPLDGGRILYALVAKTFGTHAADLAIGICTPVILLLVALTGAFVVLRQQGNPAILLVTAAVFLCFCQKNALQRERKPI